MNEIVAFGNGTVGASGLHFNSECDVELWTDIIVIGAGYGQSIAQKSNGDLVAAGSNYTGQCNVTGWKNIKISKQA